MDTSDPVYVQTPGVSIGAVSTLAGTAGHTDGNEYCTFPTAHVVAGNSVMHQRRRVNPESLALRLGPDLVRDLDALITPGNTEMPSFAVRKELQERYNIDRRHIYDYFHSRGLRVVKEDKHGNPITAKDLPTPLPNLRPLRQAPAKDPRSHPSHPVVPERKLFKPRGVTKAKPGRPKKNPLANPEIVPITCDTGHCEPLEPTDANNAPVSECFLPGTSPTPTYVAVNPLLSHVPLPSLVGESDNCTFNSVINPLDESFSVKRAIGDIAYAYRHKLVFERMQELTEYPAKLALTDDRSISGNEASPCSASDKGLLLPHVKPLSRDERLAIYKTMSDSLGPAYGMQECQGTYRKHMQTRTKLYFEGLLSTPHHFQQPAAGTLSDRKPALGVNEFRHWLSETRFLKYDGVNASPRLHPSHRNTNAAIPQDADGVTSKQYRQIFIPRWIQTLDELFPAPVDNSNSDASIMDSPVMHTREVTRTITYTRSVADDYSAGVAETQPAGHTQPHGPSAFPGTQQVKTRVPFAETSDSRPQYPEHVLYIADSGQHLAPSDTQYRGRKVSSNARARLPSCSPHVLDKIRTRPVSSRDSRRRTPSAAGDI